MLVWKGVISLSQLNSYGTFVLLVLAAILLYTILRSKYGLKISTLGLSFENSIPNVILGLRISFVLGFIWFFGALLIGEDQLLLDRSRWFYNTRGLEMASGHQLFVFFFTALVAAPIVEESVFRGFMYSPFRRKIGHKGSVFVTSLVWAIWHSDMRSAVSLIITGIILVYFYVKTQSLIPSMIIHSMTNLTWFITLLYLWLFQNDILPLNSNKFIMFMALFFLFGFIILSIISRRMSPKRRAGG
ncbi:MAG: CPBP family intramembrane metalloprotease [Deltaproteobacteria bacterium]|nr:CPBP family intramembrane metalloprotease [Deltaproteobacteria bacterium]MBW2075333.1 CPBP family intramembrane metalloprotease [Deltaproteobacteria bacterium]